MEPQVAWLLANWPVVLVALIVLAVLLIAAGLWVLFG